MHQLWIQTCIVKNGSKVRDSCQRGDVAGISEILMSNDGFTDGLCLRYICTQGLQEIERDVTALELEREASTALVLRSRPNVMEQAS